MSKTAPLFAAAALPPVKAGLLADLDVKCDAYARLAAERISKLKDLALVDAAITEVPNHQKKIVATLAVGGLALRIACLPQLLDRADALETLSADIRARVEPLAKSYRASLKLRQSAR